MDEELKRAAEAGNIDDLYAIIRRHADVFRRIDQMEFVDTPLHMAAAAGHTDFAMEMMILRPSFARKLNHDGFSPIHLAFRNGKTEMVADLVSVDKDLVRVKGREGYTPLHHVAREGNLPLLSRFLDYCPHCILDLTTRKDSALHIAAKYNMIEAFEAILRTIQRTGEDNQFQRTRILNLQDKDGNTVLHIAALNNRLEMIKLLMECKEVDRNKKNQDHLTALEVLRGQNQVASRESVRILTRPPSMINEVPRLQEKFEDSIKKMTTETINALLVVLALVLQMTYQALLSPPDGLSKADAGSNKDNNSKLTVNPSDFYMFYIPNGIAFFLAWIITITLLSVVAKRIVSSLYPLYMSMCFCYGHVLSSIAPSTFAGSVSFGITIIICLFLVFYFM